MAVASLRVEVATEPHKRHPELGMQPSCNRHTALPRKTATSSVNAPALLLRVRCMAQSHARADRYKSGPGCQGASQEPASWSRCTTLRPSQSRPVAPFSPCPCLCAHRAAAEFPSAAANAYGQPQRQARSKARHSLAKAAYDVSPAPRGLAMINDLFRI